jgi:uncharacterized protein (TIGR01370 family)
MNRLARALLATVIGAAAVGTGSAHAATDREADPRLADVRTFALALGDHAQRPDRLDELARYDLVVVDGELAAPSLIAGLQDQGTLVLGYLSVGTIERGRSWTPEAKPYRLDLWDDWGEWFADTSQPAFRSLIVDEVAPAILDRGFDGLFLDNVDMISDHTRQRAGMSTLVHALAGLTHERGVMLFAQNGEEVIDPMLDALDGWNREDVTGTYDFDSKRYLVQPPREVRAAQRALRRIGELGVFVTTTDYFAHGDDAGATRATGNACDAGAVSYVSNIGLNRIPEEPPRC